MARYALEAFGEGGQHFAHHHELIQALQTHLPSGATILIKGSRGMQMEKIVKALQEN